MEQSKSLDPRARQRLRWIEHYEKISRKVLRTARYFGISRGTFYLWYHRYMRFGLEGLKNKSCRQHKICYQIPKDVVATILMLRQQRHYGSMRMSFYLKEKYNWYVSHQTIQKLYREHGMGRLKYKKQWRRYPQRYEKAMPGDRVQMDVKFLDKTAFAGKRYYQFTAIDDCTRYRVLRIYDHQTVKSATDFVDQVRKALPFAVKQIQTDNGHEFGEPFTWHLDDLGITHRKTKIRSPEENGKVERSHRTDEEEFYRHGRFVSITHCMRLLSQWERYYNERRPHMALKGKTPRQYLEEKLKNHVSSQVRNMALPPTETVQKVG